MEMNLQDYAAMRELECGRTKGWGSTTALWVIAAVIVIAFFVYSWSKNCNEKVQFATSLSNLNGRIQCMEPSVRWAGEQLYAANGAISQLVQGVKDMHKTYGDQLFQLNDEIFFDRSSYGRCGRNGNGGCNNNGRRFEQQSTYNLASQAVTVTESCGGNGCNCNG